MTTHWQPSWWKNEVHGDAFGRVKEALRRDWEQTKKDLHVKSGHELNQGVENTVQQALGNEGIPREDRPNPPVVIGSWDDAELPVGYGHAARKQYGAEHPKWSEHLDSKLQSEWESGTAVSRREWGEVRPWVRHGYEYEGRN